MIGTIFIVICMGVFAVWGQFYIAKKNREKLLKNLDDYDKKKKAKQ